MRLTVIIFCMLIVDLQARSQAIIVTPYFPDRVNFQLYAGGEATFTIKNLPRNAVLKMRHGEIKKINASTYSITERICDHVYLDTLEIRNDNEFYKEIPFKVVATLMNDTTLHARYGLTCSSMVTKKEFLNDTVLHIMPETSNYRVDSFNLVLMPKKGEFTILKITGNKLTGSEWQKIRMYIKSSDRLIFSDIHCSRYGGLEKRIVEDVSIWIK